MCPLCLFLSSFPSMLPLLFLPFLLHFPPLSPLILLFVHLLLVVLYLSFFASSSCSFSSAIFCYCSCSLSFTLFAPILLQFAECAVCRVAVLEQLHKHICVSGWAAVAGNAHPARSKRGAKGNECMRLRVLVLRLRVRSQKIEDLAE